ncbi:hypothetical protein ACVW0P_001225 [Mucilaginibacter sp. UYNi724]
MSGPIIKFPFQLGDFGRVYKYGIAAIEDPAKVYIPIDLLSLIQTKTGVITNEPWWAVKRSPEPPYTKNWETSYEPWEAIAQGTFKDVIRKQIIEMLNLIEGIDL